MVTGVVPSPHRYVPSIFIAHGVPHCHCSWIFIECCRLTRSRVPLIIFFLQCKQNSLRVRVCSPGENWTRGIHFSTHEDNLPSHRGVCSNIFFFFCGESISRSVRAAIRCDVYDSSGIILLIRPRTKVDHEPKCGWRTRVRRCLTSKKKQDDVGWGFVMNGRRLTTGMAYIHTKFLQSFPCPCTALCLLTP